MKKALLLLILLTQTHFLYAGSKNALFNLEIGTIFATFGGKSSNIGDNNVIFTSMRAGILLRHNQYIILGKDTVVGTVSNITTIPTDAVPAPPSLFVTNEYLEYEYIFDFGFFVDLGFSASAGAYLISDGTQSSGTFLATEPQVKVIFSITPNIKMQLGYGRRFSNVQNSDLIALGLTQDSVNTALYSATVDIGGF